MTFENLVNTFEKFTPPAQNEVLSFINNNIKQYDTLREIRREYNIPSEVENIQDINIAEHDILSIEQLEDSSFLVIELQ